MKKKLTTTLDIKYLWGKIQNESLSYQDIIEIDSEYTRLIGKKSDEMLCEDELREIEDLLTNNK